MNEIKRLIKAAGYALDGLFYLLREQKNTRLLVAIAILALIICPLIGFTAFQTMIVFFAVMVTVIAEVLNTAIEIALDLIVKGEFHPQVKIAKDVAACSVFFGVITSILITLVIFFTNLSSR